MKPGMRIECITETLRIKGFSGNATRCRHHHHHHHQRRCRHQETVLMFLARSRWETGLVSSAIGSAGFVTTCKQSLSNHNEISKRSVQKIGLNIEFIMYHYMIDIQTQIIAGTLCFLYIYNMFLHSITMPFWFWNSIKPRRVQSPHLSH